MERFSAESEPLISERLMLRVALCGRGRPKFFLDGGAELIDGNQERRDENQDDQNADH